MDETVVAAGRVRRTYTLATLAEKHHLSSVPDPLRGLPSPVVRKRRTHGLYLRLRQTLYRTRCLTQKRG